MATASGCGREETTMAGVVPLGTTMHKEDPKPTKEEKVDFFNLPCPIPYEEIHCEAFSLYSLPIKVFNLFQ